MSKSVLYAANTSTQAFAATGTVINFGSIVRRYGDNLALSGGNVVARGCGYYDIDTNITFNGAAGTVVVQIYKDGVPIPGATTSTTIAANVNAQVSIPAIIREVCCNESTITVVISGVAGNVINAAIDVEKK